MHTPDEMSMPRISEFYGLVIRMYDEGHHRRRPHFHATYGEYEATIDIGAMIIIAGELPARGRRLVIEWARAHEDELRENWTLARQHKPLLSIDPLS
jgi:hypothetical protein